MSQYNFEGDLENISERQLEFINDVIKEHGFENSKVTFERVGQAGDNYMANVKRIKVEGETESISIIAKIAPAFEVFRKIMNADVLYNNEHTIYTQVLPKFDQLQKDAGIPEEEQLKFAKCYGSSGEAPNEVILLEDLKTLNYTMLDRFEPLPNDCIKSVLKNFAVYHALSYALKYKEPETYEGFKSTLLDIWTLPGNEETVKLFLAGVESDTLKILDNPEHQDLVKKYFKSLVDVSHKLAKADNDSKYSVIVQGDPWTNNVMFNLEDENIVKSIMIDYQIAKNGFPVYDLLYMIFNCTEYECRKENFYNWIDYYHSELEKSLSNFNLKVNFVYPRDKLDADLKRYGKLLFGLSILVSSFLIRKTDDAEKMQNLMQSDNVIERIEEFGVVLLDDNTKNRYKTRITGLITSFLDLGLI